MAEKPFTLEQFDKMVLNRQAAWWQMTLPKGTVTFGDAKTEMLGRRASDFKHYEDFTNLLHPEDHPYAMKAMQKHLDGEEDLYEVWYRIQHKDGQYVAFYDCGQIVEKKDNAITVMGFVMKVDTFKDLMEQMKDFKKLILDGSPSMYRPGPLDTEITASIPTPKPPPL